MILSGIAGDSCVLASAFDARMRGFAAIVPQDCTASNTAKRNRNAIAVMRTMEVEVTSSTRL